MVSNKSMEEDFISEVSKEIPNKYLNDFGTFFMWYFKINKING